MVDTVLGDETKREVSKISLFNNTVRRRIPTCATKFARRSVPVNFWQVFNSQSLRTYRTKVISSLCSLRKRKAGGGGPLRMAGMRILRKTNIRWSGQSNWLTIEDLISGNDLSLHVWFQRMFFLHLYFYFQERWYLTMLTYTSWNLSAPLVVLGHEKSRVRSYQHFTFCDIWRKPNFILSLED